METGLSALGLNSPQNLGLLLNLLGLAPPEDALAGLDGLLIGLRTRDLMLALLEARSRVLPLALLIEDLHWIDSASEELLDKIVGSEATLRALVLLTRRSEYCPPWASRSRVAKLALEPLPAGNMRQLVQTRLGVEVMPDALAHAVTERAEGNPLFGEEIASFLTERGMVRTLADKIGFDQAAVSEALPSSVQSLLTARVDRLAPERRALLQSASVIGRRFDLDLLAAAAGTEVDIRQALAEIEPFDLVRALGGDGEWAFKHALLRDVLYQSLLTGPRTALHLRIAEEIERRSGNRLPEVAETLAHHYGLTDRADKAFAFLAMAGKKSLGLYAFEEAGRHFAAAIALLDKSPVCATDTQVANLLADFALFSDLTAQRTSLVLETVERFAPRLMRLGDHPAVVQTYHQYALALDRAGRLADARKERDGLLAMARRLRDPRSIAYALASDILLAPFGREGLAEAISEAYTAASRVDDAYLHYFLRFIVASREFNSGRLLSASAIAEDAIAIGRKNNDPRSMGFGLGIKAMIAVVRGDNDEAIGVF